MDDPDETQDDRNPEKKKSTSNIEDETLLDVRVHNPLKRITELLEEIKKQKAFSFTLKGSLGIMGVALGLSFIGFLGTNYALCDKGTQTQIGSMRALSAQDYDEDSIFNRLKNISNYFTSIVTGRKIEERNEKRTILITYDYKTIHLKRGRDVSLSQYRGQDVIVTGPFNSCNQTLKVQNQTEIEKYFK